MHRACTRAAQPWHPPIIFDTSYPLIYHLRLGPESPAVPCLSLLHAAQLSCALHASEAQTLFGCASLQLCLKQARTRLSQATSLQAHAKCNPLSYDCTPNLVMRLTCRLLPSGIHERQVTFATNVLVSHHPHHLPDGVCILCICALNLLRSCGCRKRSRSRHAMQNGRLCGHRLMRYCPLLQLQNRRMPVLAGQLKQFQLEPLKPPVCVSASETDATRGQPRQAHRY